MPFGFELQFPLATEEASPSFPSNGSWRLQGIICSKGPEELIRMLGLLIVVQRTMLSSGDPSGLPNPQIDPCKPRQAFQSVPHISSLDSPQRSVDVTKNMHSRAPIIEGGAPRFRDYNSS